MNELKTKTSLLDQTAPGIRAMAAECCRQAKKLEDSGYFEEACETLAPFWEGPGSLPNIDFQDFDAQIKAEILLRAGVLTGWAGTQENSLQIQETAKNLISESQSVFEQLGLIEKTAEAQIELAYCYWREGAFDDAKAYFSMVIDGLPEIGETANDLKALAYLRSAIVEHERKDYAESIRLLKTAERFFDKSLSHSLKGKYHNEFAQTLQALAIIEDNSELSDRALIEYTAAAFHFEEAGHRRFQMYVENNIGWLLFEKKLFTEALDHFEIARKMAVRLSEKKFPALVDENRACVYLEMGQYEIAEQLSRRSIAAFEKAERFAFMADSLLTNGKALARLGSFSLARRQFEKSEQISAQMGTADRAGLALLTLLEELNSELTFQEIRGYYQNAARYLRSVKQSNILRRLLKCANYLVEKYDFDSTPSEKTMKVEQPTAQRQDIAEIILHSQIKFQKSVEFTPEAIQAIDTLFLKDNFKNIEKIIETTVQTAAHNERILPESVEIVAIRNTSDIGFANPWENLSLRDLTQNIEKRLIELALQKSDGKITGAAKLLGFKHYEMLNSIIKTRHPDLLTKRLPPAKRIRSIIKKRQ